MFVIDGTKTSLIRACRSWIQWPRVSVILQAGVTSVAVTTAGIWAWQSGGEEPTIQPLAEGARLVSSSEATSPAEQLVPQIVTYIVCARDEAAVFSAELWSVGVEWFFSESPPLPYQVFIVASRAEMEALLLGLGTTSSNQQLGMPQGEIITLCESVSH